MRMRKFLMLATHVCVKIKLNIKERSWGNNMAHKIIMGDDLMRMRKFLIFITSV